MAENSNIFVFEFVAGGGWQVRQGADPPASLLREGQAMLTAVVEDFRRAGHGITTTWSGDARLSKWLRARVVPVANVRQLHDAIVRESGQADWSLIIAPEFDGLLADYCRLARGAGARLLNCSEEVIRMASDKHATAAFLAQRNVPAPRGALPRRSPDGFDAVRYPAILKPRYGAGSQHVRLVHSAAEARRFSELAGLDWRLEEFRPGLPASVSFLCGPGGSIPLAPGGQRLANDGSFAYLGGELPLSGALARRATDLGQRAIQCLHGACGYVGVDLVLGEADNGSEDVVIEINPRLTTSYVGLRRLYRQNLASAMLRVAAGEDVDFEPLSAAQGLVRFAADGTLRRSRSRAPSEPLRHGNPRT
jgi:predicted ATP-grasp superfamily ATP-dependent carboligase